MRRALVTVAGTITGIGVALFFTLLGVPDVLNGLRDKIKKA